MRVTLIYIGTLVMAGGLAHQAIAEDPYWYAEGGYHFVTVDEEGIDFDLGMLAVGAGYEFGNGFALEAGIGQGIQEDNVMVLGTDVSVKLGTSYGVAAKYSFDVGEKARLHGKVRYTSFEVEAEALGITISESDEEFGWGIGGTYDLSDRAYGMLEFNKFTEDSNAYFIGFGFSF